MGKEKGTFCHRLKIFIVKFIWFRCSVCGRFGIDRCGGWLHSSCPEFDARFELLKRHGELGRGRNGCHATVKFQSPRIDGALIRRALYASRGNTNGRARVSPPFTLVAEKRVAIDGCRPTWVPEPTSVSAVAAPNPLSHLLQHVRWPLQCHPRAIHETRTADQQQQL